MSDRKDPRTVGDDDAARAYAIERAQSVVDRSGGLLKPDLLVADNRHIGGIYDMRLDLIMRRFDDKRTSE